MHFGIIAPPVPGHIHPMGALGRELIARGHRVTLIHMEDVRARALKEGLEFAAIGHRDHPAGSLPVSLAELGKLEGLAALHFTIKAVRNTTEMFCRDAPEAIRAEGIDALIVDQTEPAGGTVAEYLGLPFVTVANALLLNRENGVPPPFSDWEYRSDWWARMRNRAGYAVSRLVMRPVSKTVAQYRRAWNLNPLADPDHSSSALAQICQLPRELDYPRQHLPPSFHYTGPLRRDQPSPTPFPWDRLSGRPLIYASLGTLQNSREPVFRCFAEACRGLDVQLVMSHGGGLDDRAAAALAADALVVPYAPQLALLKQAALTITHAGLNTVLDSLASGVPLIAVPITYEQPAIAARVRWSGAGAVIPFSQLTAKRLRDVIQLVLQTKRYRENALRIASSIQSAGGVSRAAEIIESAVPLRTNSRQAPESTSLR